ncbi:MAG: DnaB-like helicase C-terminal domain-containing protein [Planctomycetaceae bacterium]|jgi:hypothetical protein|nr:DnaB-like helicase C-terminal domain-containing protein [Planctomycetaceae bacterium]
MEVESFNAEIERRILIGMITDDVVASSVSASLDTSKHFNFFRTDIANLIGKWAVIHHTKYGVAPREAILSRFQSFQDKNPNKELSQQINDLLSSLDFESEQDPIQNRDYLIDQASRYFTEVRLEKIADKIKAGIQTSKLEDSLDAINSFQRVELGADLGIDPIRNEPAIRQAFETTSEQLIHFNKQGEDDISQFFGDSLSRDNLIGFLAAEKTGKSMWLLDLAWRAVQEKRKVAFFEVGDMSQNQVMIRLMLRITGIPKKIGVFKIPNALQVDAKHNIEIDFNEIPVKEAISADDAVKKCRKLIKKHGEEERLRLSVHPNNSIGVLGIESRLDIWERSGWIPDVIVIDYADFPNLGIA